MFHTYNKYNPPYVQSNFTGNPGLTNFHTKNRCQKE